MTLQSSLGIAAQGLDAAGERMTIHANNIANLTTPNYQRKIPVLMENNEMSFENIMAQMRNGVIQTGISTSPGGVHMAGSIADSTPGKRVYNPGHPEADKDGFVQASNVNVLADMSDSLSTQRVYEANLAVISMVKAMANRALEIGRGQ